MRICHITSMHPWDNVRIYQRACMGLLKKGLEIHLIATYPGKKPQESGVQFHWLKQRQGWKRRIYSSREAYKLALNIDADVFHFHDPDLLPWMLFLSFKGKKVVYDAHENYTERVLGLSFPNWIRLPLAKFWSFFECFCVAKFAGIITTTYSMQSIFSNINIPKLVVSNTIYLSALGDVNLKVDKKPFTIYTSGSHSDKRNCMQTIEALPFILKKIPEVRLIFVGTYYPEDYDIRLKYRAKELGVERRVETEGILSYKDNFSRTAQMEIGCVFYEDNVNNRVTIPNRLFEYMYAGVAVIGESFFEVKKVIEESHCGILVNSSDPESIADGVIRLFSDIAALRKMQSNGRSKIISTYAYEHELEKMNAFYNSLIVRV
jgi:glycosyltransferase involved in cell wall biosynthesis